MLWFANREGAWVETRVGESRVQGRRSADVVIGLHRDGGICQYPESCGSRLCLR